MRSFKTNRDDRHRIYLGLAGSIESKLRDLYVKRAEAGLVSQTSLADKLVVNKSAINRRLSGGTNMTLKTVADMVWALDGCIECELFAPEDRPERNNLIRVKSKPLSIPTADSTIKVVKTEWLGESVSPKNTFEVNTQVAAAQ